MFLYIWKKNYVLILYFYNMEYIFEIMGKISTFS